MKNINLITHCENGVRLFLVVMLPFLLSSCYTVLKQSSDYYSEFDQKSISKDSAAQIAGDDMAQAKDDSTIKKDEETDNETTIVNNYYGSAWGGYPYSRWSLSLGYGYYPYYTGWYDWGYYPSWDYWYWGGCYYPTVYTGRYRPYYPYYDFTPVYPNARRNFGGRHYVTQTSGIGLVGSSYGRNSTVSSSQRRYKTGSSETTKNNKTVSRHGRRQYRSGNNAAGPTKKATNRKQQRTYRNDKSFARAFENAARSQSSRSVHSASTSRSSSGSGGGSHASAPRSSGGGGRSYRK